MRRLSKQMYAFSRMAFLSAFLIVLPPSYSHTQESARIGDFLALWSSIIGMTTAAYFYGKHCEKRESLNRIQTLVDQNSGLTLQLTTTQGHYRILQQQHTNLQQQFAEREQQLFSLQTRLYEYERDHGPMTAPPLSCGVAYPVESDRSRSWYSQLRERAAEERPPSYNQSVERKRNPVQKALDRFSVWLLSR